MPMVPDNGLENLEPAVRLEAILDGQDIAPATRLEYFLKKAAEGGGNGVMLFDISLEGTFSNRYYVSSKTYTEIITAISADVMPIAKMGVGNVVSVFTINSYNDGGIQFLSPYVEIPPEESAEKPVFSNQVLTITSTNEVHLYIVHFTAD